MNYYPKILILLLTVFTFAGNIFFTPKKLAELKSSPSRHAETIGMLKKGAVLEVKSIITDSLGREWYMVRDTKKGGEGFIISESLEFLGDEEKSETFLKLSSVEKEDKKRRIQLLKKHPRWPRRIKRAVRNGTVCLKMTEKQLTASWQLPYIKTSGFILGFGQVRIFFYNEANPIAVVIKNGEVIGWSEKEI